MDIATFRSLLTPAGQEILQAAEALHPKEEDFLRHYQSLQRRYPAEMARLALEIAILRGRAITKFSFAGQLYLTREAFEQASSYEVSSYRAKRYQACRLIADLGCSVGGDTLALAPFRPVIGIDKDGLRLKMAQANLRSLGLGDQALLLQADLANPLPFQPSDKTGLFFDPARRADGQRIHSVKNYSPPLSMVKHWLDLFPAVGVKISPGVDRRELAEYPAEVEFISLKGELKEAVLWFGPLKSTDRRATILPGAYTLAAEGVEVPKKASTVSEPRNYLYEPDPAVIRAGMIDFLVERLEASQLDVDIAYITGDKLMPTPFARAWQVEGWLPFNLKRLRAYLRAREVGRVTVKKRGSPLQPEALIQALHLAGEAERVIILTHLKGRPIVVVCFPDERGKGEVDSVGEKGQVP